MTSRAEPSARRRWRCVGTVASVALVVLLLSACADDGSEPVAASTVPTPSTSPAVAGSASASADDGARAAVEDRFEIGPRAVDIDRSMTMVVDSLDATGDDIFIRLRIVNLRNEYLDLGVQHTWIGPLVVLYDDRGNSYESRAVEPAGIHPSSVGHVRFRLEGPLRPDAETFTVELASQRGTLTTPPAPVPIGGSVRWLEARSSSTPGQAVVDGERTIQVREFTDHGTHLEIVIETSDASGDLSGADMIDASLVAGDGTRLRPLGGSTPPGRRADVRTVELRFPIPPSGVDDLTLDADGVAVELPEVSSLPPEVDPMFAASPRLSDLLDQWLTFEPLPTSTASTRPAP